MHGIAVDAAVLAGLSKHDDAGIVAVVVGAVLIVVGALKMATRAAKNMVLVPVVGAVVVIVGILFFTRAI